MRRSLGVGLWALSLCLLQSCGWYAKDQGVPAYLHVDTVQVVGTPQTQGTLSARVKDVWLYIDGDLQGAYPLPATIPLLRDGTVRLQFNAGILLNGISATRAAYPFFVPWDTVVDLYRGRTDTLRPRTSYRNTVRYVWLEDFDNLGFGLRARSGSDTVLLRESRTDSVFEGLSSLYMSVDQRAPYLVAESIDQFGLTAGKPCFLELNYRNNVPLQVGLQSQLGSDISDPLWIVELAPAALWSKQYINFSPYLGVVNGARYRVLLRPLHPSGSTVTSRVWVDNLKLLQ
ncbi:MAG: hypothetical protein ACOYNE_01395 [Bacteroidia bacterium]